MDLDTLTSLRLPEWPDEGTDPTLRDSELEHPTAPVPTSFGAQRGAGMSLPLPMPSSVQGGMSGGVTPLGTPPVHGAAAVGKGAWTDLDTFYAENEESESEEEEESEEDEDEDESEEEESENGQKSAPLASSPIAFEATTSDPQKAGGKEAEPEGSVEEDGSEEEESVEHESDEAAPLTSSPWADR